MINKLPITNTNNFVKIDNYSDYWNIKKKSEWFYFSLALDGICHFVEHNGNNEGIEIVWKNNPFDLEYNKDNYIKLI